MPLIVDLGAARLYMYRGDHNPPHFHVLEGDAACTVRIDALTVMAGRVSPRALRAALAWAEANRDALNARWRAYNEEDDEW
ncbi:MAG: DUF4160 domain-containing protein [Caenispirillum bisanense]|nr:DUF4160 domain-containing protein [Caenispirillum bisanense]MCA1971957.1 DUF4160 domain-containing protein [Caenispirillum sp.]